MRLRVNGVWRELDLREDTPLLWALREGLGLTGTKYGCGVGQCGACTVHLDGEAARSCSVPLGAVGAREVTTIEGLAESPGDPVIEAWVALDVAQCGYCQPGQVMSASALLRRRPDPSDEEIRRAMAGNLCRCGTYGRILAAVRRAAGRRDG